MKPQIGNSPWSITYGVGRTILALASLSTLLFSDVDALFRPLGMEFADAPTAATSISRISLYYVLRGEYLVLAKAIAIAILLLTAVGYRPRITGILHWWVAYSYQASAVMVEGGDQVASLLALLLVPVTLTDSRTWHFSTEEHTAGPLREVVARSSLWMLRLQVACIYLFAFAHKVAVSEWKDGTVMYYWAQHPQFGLADWVRPWLDAAFSQPVPMSIVTWSVLALEATLFAGLFMSSRARGVMLALGITFHAGIAVVHGLAGFALTMIAALWLFLASPETSVRLAALWRRARARVSALHTLARQPAKVRAS